jgi:hypothetical protein
MRVQGTKLVHEIQRTPLLFLIVQENYAVVIIQ